jgi:hypothetical protein
MTRQRKIKVFSDMRYPDFSASTKHFTEVPRRRENMIILFDQLLMPKRFEKSTNHRLTFDGNRNKPLTTVIAFRDWTLD